MTSYASSIPTKHELRRNVHHDYLTGCEASMRDGYKFEPAELETLRQRTLEAACRGEWVGTLPAMLAELDGNTSKDV